MIGGSSYYSKVTNNANAHEVVKVSWKMYSKINNFTYLYFKYLQTLTLHSGSHCRNTGLFISPSGTSELDCATTKTDTAERSISIGSNLSKLFFCTTGLGVLAGSTARG